MILEPLGDWLVVDPEGKPEKIGSIYIPQGARDDKAPYRGTVVKAGPGQLKEGAATVLKPDLVLMRCQVGDFIIFNRYTTSQVEIDSKTYLLVRDQDVFMIVRPDTPVPTPTQSPGTAESN